MPWDVKCLFDKSVQVKQLDICELNNLMIFLTTTNSSSNATNSMPNSNLNNLSTNLNNDYNDQSACSSNDPPMTSTSSATNSNSVGGGSGTCRLCIFNLDDFNSSMDNDENPNINNSSGKLTAMNKLHCKEKRLDFLPSNCHLYAVSKQIVAKQLKLVAACGKKLYIVKLKDIIHFNSNANNNNKTNIPVTSCISNLNNAANQIAVNPILGLNLATNTTTTTANDALASVGPQTTVQQSKKVHSSIKKGHSAASFMFKNSSNKGEVETPKQPPPLQHQHSMTTTTSAHCSSSSNLDNNQHQITVNSFYLKKVCELKSNYYIEFVKPNNLYLKVVLLRPRPSKS